MSRTPSASLSRQSRQAVRRLLAAVERSLDASREVEAARAALLRVAGQAELRVVSAPVEQAPCEDQHHDG